MIELLFLVFQAILALLVKSVLSFDQVQRFYVSGKGQGSVGNAFIPALRVCCLTTASICLYADQQAFLFKNINVRC
jgi:hypothetical protein